MSRIYVCIIEERKGYVEAVSMVYLHQKQLHRRPSVLVHS